MNIKKIIYLIMIPLLFTSGCKKNEDLNSNAISFTVRVSEVSYNYARVTVKHNGPEDITWYGFLTDEITKNEATVFYEKYMEIIKSGKIEGLRRDQERNILLDGLQEEKKYKYIAFGIKENGELYENSGMGSIEFETVRNIYVLNQTHDWEMERLGRNDDGKELVEVKPTKGGRFGWSYVSKESIDSWNEEYPDGYELWVDDIYMTTVNGFQMFALEQISTIQYYVSMGYKLTDLTYIHEEGKPFELDRLASGDYYLIAYGFMADGQHTQTFSVKEITIEEEEATEGYLEWLGDYTFTGEVETTSETGEEIKEERTYNISIKEYDNNFMYMVHGWECGDDVKYDWEEDIMQLDKEEGEYLSFPAFYNDGKLEIKEYPMTYITFDGVESLVLGIYGYAFNSQYSQEIPVILDETSMALAEPIAEGQTTTQLVGQKAKYEADGSTTEWEYCKMGYLAWNEYTGAYQTVNPPMRFPITIERSAGTSPDPIPSDPESASGISLFSKKISTDFLRNDFSKLEKMKPEIYQRAY